jgi:Domain of unknown function (DUF1905)
VELELSGEIIFWQGPSPFHFVAVPEAESDEIEAVSSSVTYGWGAIPVTAHLGRTKWKTSLFPKDGRYLVPIKAKVREAERLALGDVVTIRLILAVR